MPSAIPRGRAVWHELLTSDPDGATSFYTKLIGWGTQVWEGGPSPYRMWMNGETAVGGVMQLPDEAKQQGAPPHWLAYVATPDVDQTIKDAEARGGRVLSGPMDVPTVGRIAVMADPQGTVFAAHTAAGEAPGHNRRPRPSRNASRVKPCISQSPLSDDRVVRMGDEAASRPRCSSAACGPPRRPGRARRRTTQSDG